MTNSALGETLIPPLINALSCLLGLPEQPAWPSWSGGLEKTIPLLPSILQSEAGWQHWAGTWTTSGFKDGQKWHIVEVKGGNPGLRFNTIEEAMVLVPAAVPTNNAEDEKKRSFWLLVDGLDIGVRLTWEGEERVVRIIQDQAQVLRRKA